MLYEKSDKIMVLGSCFAAGIGERLLREGYEVCINPFGTLFNPVSIHNAIERLRSGRPFTLDECVQMGAGSELWCSFSHYTKFARSTKAQFLEEANEALEYSSNFYRRCNKLIITFGTAWCFRHLQRQVIVSNCLKRPAREFERFRLGVDDIAGLYSDLDKDTVFTVSPIRHLSDGAWGNNLSKATLLLAVEQITRGKEHLSYFPAYEIMMDELRDYRWYAQDGAHPSELAREIIFDRFLNDFGRK